MKIDILNEIKLPNFNDLRKKKILEKSLMFLVLSVVISYLLSPKIIFTPTIYKEGDIILHTISINEDLLIPDKVSTQLKKEQLLKQQRPIYDFDPNILENTKKKIHESFQTIRNEFQQIENQVEEMLNRNRSLGLAYFMSVSNLQEVTQQVSHYQRYKAALQKRLKEIHGEGKLTAKGFLRKKKLDADLKTVTQILNELDGKIIYYNREQESFTDRFQKIKIDNENLISDIDERRKTATSNFNESLLLELSDAERQLLDFPFYTNEIETQLIVLLTDILNQRIIISKDILLPEGKEKIEMRNLVTGETSKIDSLQEFYDISEARLLINDLVKEYFPGDETGRKKNLLILLGQKLIRPTVSENKQEYEKRKENLSDNMSKVYFSVKKGEVIARAGNRVTHDKVELINSYYEVVSNINKLPRMAGVVLFVLFSLVLISFSFQFPGSGHRLPLKKHLLIMTSVLITLILIKGGLVIGEVIETRYLDSQSGVYNYVLPVALGAMLAGILLGFEAALMTGLLTALFTSIMMQGNLYFFFYAIMGSIVAALPMTRFDSRYSILLHGLKISAVNLPMLMILYLIESNQIGVINWISITSALFSGVLTALLTSFLLPFFESIFDITTNLKLLELSNMNHPALKELIFKAPGTYQHSIIVGNLAESAAVKVGANSLLSRVASYYHDIGKATDAHFYIENQAPNYPNIHDSMNPYDSAKVIIKHLQKGAEVAEKYRLGKDITDILLQHHGTNLVKYFFNKAKEQSIISDDNIETERAKFCYAGPKPQSMEAALVMLADMAEASTRSLNKPTPELIREITEKVCWAVLDDGQLDESGMTLQTFHTIVDMYSSMLISIHHHRIKYPEDSDLRNNSKKRN